MSLTGSAPTDLRVASAVGVRRFVNDSIKETAERFGDHSTAVYDFLCECGDLRAASSSA